MPGSQALRNAFKLHDIVNVKDPAFGAKGDGATDDAAAILAASAGGTAVYFPAQNDEQYLVGSALTLDSTFDRVKWYGDKSIIKKGFNGDLLTVQCAGFEAHGIEFEGQHGTFTGKGIVFSGSGSNNPVLFNCVTSAFTDSHIEFEADAGHSAQIIGHRGEVHASQSDARMLHVNGPDTGARIRRIVASSFEGWIDLDGASNFYIGLSQFTRIEPNSACRQIFIMGNRWGNASGTMTLSGECRILGNSFSGDVVLDANFAGTFVGNTQSAGTFTNNTVGGNAIVLHHPLAQPYDLLDKHRIRTGPTVPELIQTSRTVSAGDTSPTLTPGGTAPVVRFASTLTAERTATLSDTALEGDRFFISRTGPGNFHLKVQRANAFLLTVLQQNDWCQVDYDGSAWNVTASGTVPGSAKLLSSHTAVGNVGTGEDDLISLATWVGSIGQFIGDAYAVPRAVKIKAWGTTANTAAAKTVRLKANASTLLTTALTTNQAGTWEIEATILASGNNTQDYTARLLQGGATTIVDVENGALALTDNAAITYKVTGDATNNDDIVQEGMTIEFLG